MSVDEYFDQRGRFIPAILADEIQGETVDHYLITPITDKGGDVTWLYHHDLGIFKPDGIAYIEGQVKERLRKRCKRGHVGEVLKLVQIGSYEPKEHFIEDPDVIVLKNGVLKLDEKKLKSYNAVYNAKSRLPLKYDPSATCPRILKFLSEVAPDYLEFLQQWTGYHLLKDYRYQRCVVLVGDGDNGKSTYLNLLTAFLGQENVSGQTMYRLTVNRFAPAQLDGKLANIADDIGPEELKHTSILKMLTGGAWFDVEKKNRDPFYLRNHAKLTFSCNQAPKTPDESLAFYKRFIPLKFNVIVPKEKQDPLLLKKLTTPEELSGFLNWALEGLDKLNKQGGLLEPSSLEERRELYRRMSDPITGFINDCVIEDPEEWEEKQDVFNAFTRYCKDRGFAACSDIKFFKTFRNQTYCREEQRKRGKRRPRGFKGVKLMRGAQDTRGTQGSLSAHTQPSFVEGICNPVYPVHPVQGTPQEASELLPDKEKLFVDAIRILQENAGRMKQKAFFQALIDLQYPFVSANLALRGDPRFVFMGMDVKLGAAAPQEAEA